LFEVSFDEAEEPPPPAPLPEPEAPPPPTFSEAELAAARAEGFAAGRAAADAEHQRRNAQRLADALEGVAAGLAAAKPALDEALAAHARASIEVAAALARKLGGAAGRTDVAGPVTALVAECLPRLLDEPRIVVRVAEATLDEVRGHVTRAAERAGYHGKVVLIGDPEIKEPACRVEWADGGAEYDPARVAAEADAAIARFLAGGAGPHPTNA
jgi:flagellar assembly protein FliH